MRMLFCLFIGIWFLHSCTVEKRLDKIIKLLEEKQKRE